MIGIAVGTLGILGSLAGGANWVENHFETRTHAAQVRQDDEQRHIQSDIDLYLLKIDYLEHKSDQTQQDRDEIKYLQELVAKLRDRLRQIG